MRQQYNSYKPSGIDWIGDIPSHWTVCRIKDCFILKTGTTPKGFDKPINDNEINWFTPSDINSSGTILHEAERKLSENLINKEGISLFPQKSLIFVGIGATAGKLGYAEVAGYSNQQITGLIPKSCCSKYYFYYLCHDSQRVRDNASFTTLPIINNSYLSQVYWVMPPLAEQEAIAAWLDEKCGEIDAAIAKVDREIELIDELKQSEISRVVTRGLNPDAPLRPSGIDWIGNIPSHWTKCRFKNFMYLKTNPSCSQVKVGLENLESGSGKFIESDTEFEGNGVEFCHNDILYGKLRPYLRKVWLAEFSGNAVGDFFVFGNYSNSAASYLKYLFLSDGFTKQADGSTFGAKMPRVSSEFILTLPFYLPPLSEQQAIADYLDKKCSEFDKLKAKLSKKRETLTELRQSIISEVVTGKRKVI